ncbi:hypothetical protein [Metabacillus fastidiosus]|uniref:hypothetical protein n=1 Tax=Metabacillus fastidiosus TaxID=1458 RepID=UPI002DC0148D|nr:hypothetical protein [Metabacillus fastidiosus]MEC2074565.1 hypothetical protein [Metabacillus fastidiosus]
MNSTDVFDFLKNRGILVSAYTKEDYAKVGMDFYFSRENYLELKKKIDGEPNYRKSSRYTIPTDQLDDLKDALISISNQLLDEENTKVRVIGSKDGNWSFEVNYTEYKPSMINFLDTTERIIEVKVNQQKGFSNLEGTNDHKKITQILNLIHEQNKEIKFEFADIDLSKLSEDLRIALFDNFFKVEDTNWELKKILKIKVNRDDTPNTNPDPIKDEQLQGINSALLDGENLLENKFVKKILEEKFYFTMATMRYDHKTEPKYIDFSLDFKTRPGRFEPKITGSGEYEEDEKGIKEVKKVLDRDEQDDIIFQFKNEIQNIYTNLLNNEQALVFPDIEVVKDTAATLDNFE